jgi:transcriptional regulator with XRE-family HTH domain
LVKLLDRSQSEIPKLLRILKSIYKAKGLLYEDVAAGIGVSQATVKRYLNGLSLSVELLEAMCGVAEIQLADLVDALKDERRELPMLSIKDEEALASDPFLAALFYLLCKGFLPQVLQRDLDLGDAEMNHYLTTLDRLGLIQLFPYNKVRVQVARGFKMAVGGPLMKLTQTSMLDAFFRRFDVANKNWQFDFCKLSPAATEHVRELQRNFMDAVAAVAERDRDLPLYAAEWQGIFLMVQPIRLQELKDWAANARNSPVTRSAASRRSRSEEGSVLAKSLDRSRSKIPELLRTLKSVYKGKGLLYQHVAAAMGVSETAVKRYLTGHSLSLEILETLCRIADVRLSDLIDMARDERRDLVPLSLDEEEALAADPFLAALFYLLCKGFLPQVLQRDLELSQAEIDGYLAKLAELDLIQLSFDAARVRVDRSFEVAVDGPLARITRASLLDNFFRQFDVTGENWQFEVWKLSPASADHVRELQRNFLAAVAAVAERDRALPSSVVAWQGVFLALQPVNLGELKNWTRRVPDPKAAQFRA